MEVESSRLPLCVSQQVHGCVLERKNVRQPCKQTCLQTDQVVYIICVHFLYVKHTSIKCLFKKWRNNESKIKKDSEIPTSFVEDEILLHPTPSLASKRPRCEAWPVRCPTPRTALQGQFTASQVQQALGVGS